MKKRTKRLWVDGFRIAYSHDNKIIADQMDEWKSERQRPKHFIRAMKLYISLLSGNLDTFYEILTEFAPRLAIQMMRQTPVDVPSPQLTRTTAQPKAKAKTPPPKPILLDDESGPSDSLAASLGLDDIEF